MAASQTFGDVVRERRLELDLTQEQVAEVIDIRAGYLSRIERDKVPPPSDQVCRGLEHVLKFDRDELVRLAHVTRLPDDMRRLVSFQEDLRAAEVEIQEELVRRAHELPTDLPVEELKARWAAAVEEVEAGVLERFASWDEARKGLLSGSVRRLAEAQGEMLLLRAELLQRLAPRGEGGRDLQKAFETGELTQLVERLEGNVEAVTGLGQRVPVINKVAAGYPTEFTDMGFPVGVADDYVRCPGVEDANAFAIRVCGDSMEPRYREGDIIIISPAAPVRPGDDCFVRISATDESTFKRVFFDPEEQVRLQPLNERYPPQSYDRRELGALYRAVKRIENL
jgi:phage repressor protein C with HTH and peptisase S24 domain/DNA-binding XRE family transcriptional regulator